MTTIEPPVVSYVEHCLPGASLDARLRTARDHDLALEVANRSDFNFERLRGSGMRIAAVQAYRMHELHPLHPDPDHRVAAREHVKDSIEKARSLAARHVVTVCGFGHEVCDRPFERCLEFFDAIAPWARTNGVRILIEKLSRHRAGAMTEATEMESLLGELDARDVFGTLIDTGHLLDDGHDPASYLDAWRLPVDEFQLRGAGSHPPSRDAPLEKWLSTLGLPPAVVSVEHGHPIDPNELAPLIKKIRTILGRCP